MQDFAKIFQELAKTSNNWQILETRKIDLSLQKCLDVFPKIFAVYFHFLEQQHGNLIISPKVVWWLLYVIEAGWFLIFTHYVYVRIAISKLCRWGIYHASSICSLVRLGRIIRVLMKYMSKSHKWVLQRVKHFFKTLFGKKELFLQFVIFLSLNDLLRL